MNDLLQGLTDEYASALQRFLSEPQESGRMRAYELGRRALALSVGGAELAIVHGQALAAALADAATSEERKRLTHRAAEFLGETLAPFEMVLRGHREANVLLQNLNDTLEQRVKLRTAALKESEERYRDLFENAGEMILGATPDGRLLYVNRAWRTNLGYEDAEVAGLSWTDLVHHEHRTAFLEICRRALAGENLEQVESVFVTKDGRSLVVEGTVNCHCVDGQPVTTRGIFRDITQRKHMEEELKETARSKDEFLAILAHELRNPLAPIRNAVQIFRAKAPPVPELQWARDVIERQVHQMTRLIDDLLDVSRITRGKIELQKERIELTAVLNSAVEASRPLIEKWNQELTVTVPREPVYLEADLTRLSQVLLNLLNNAAKYTKKGGHIWLIAERDGDHVLIRVKDNGIGIPAEMLPHIFEMFMQVDRSLERAQGGLGIGLTLVQQLVTMHGGTVEAYSAGPGTGCEFTVRLPVGTDLKDEDLQNLPGDRIQAHAPLPRRILVVDDNKDSADSLGMLLRMTGNDVHIAYDGLEAVGAVAAFQPQVVLLDIGLPKLNGYDAGRRIREQPGGRDLVLIALTGWGQEEDRRRSKDAGFDQHITKPVDFAALQQLLAALKQPLS